MASKRYKKGLIIVNAYVVLPPLAAFAKRMTEEMKTLGIEMDTRSAAEIFTYIDRSGEIVIKEPFPYDFVLYLDKDRYIASLLQKKCICIFNSAHSIEDCDDKMLTYLSLAERGIKMPKTVPGPLNYSGSPDGEFLNNLVKILSFPIVVKQNFGSMGRGVFLAKNMEELKEIEAKISSEPRLYQEYIDSSYGRDHRLIVIDKKVICGYERNSEGRDFRSNLGVGGTGKPIELTKEEIEMAEEAARAFRLDYCGVDLLIGPDEKPILCEVNSNAFFEGAEKVTGVNVARAYALHIYEWIYG